MGSNPRPRAARDGGGQTRARGSGQRGCGRVGGVRSGKLGRTGEDREGPLAGGGSLRPKRARSSRSLWPLHTPTMRRRLCSGGRLGCRWQRRSGAAHRAGRSNLSGEGSRPTLRKAGWGRSRHEIALLERQTAFLRPFLWAAAARGFEELRRSAGGSPRRPSSMLPPRRRRDLDEEPVRDDGARGELRRRVAFWRPTRRGA